MAPTFSPTGGGATSRSVYAVNNKTIKAKHYKKKVGYREKMFISDILKNSRNDCDTNLSVMWIFSLFL